LLSVIVKDGEKEMAECLARRAPINNTQYSSVTIMKTDRPIVEAGLAHTARA
jgi:hypothetical protein